MRKNSSDTFSVLSSICLYSLNICFVAFCVCSFSLHTVKGDCRCEVESRIPAGK